MSREPYHYSSKDFNDADSVDRFATRGHFYFGYGQILQHALHRCLLYPGIHPTNVLTLDNWRFHGDPTPFLRMFTPLPGSIIRLTDVVVRGTGEKWFDNIDDNWGDTEECIHRFDKIELNRTLYTSLTNLVIHGLSLPTSRVQHLRLDLSVYLYRLEEFGTLIRNIKRRVRVDFLITIEVHTQEEATRLIESTDRFLRSIQFVPIEWGEFRIRPLSKRACAQVKERFVNNQRFIQSMAGQMDPFRQYRDLPPELRERLHQNLIGPWKMDYSPDAPAQQ